ncbi:Guanine/hypoxanthine permease pbuG [Hondaea fermentalgiana]|uniref:Guanine/hypoxanthine permease pbuG n=1 Tax=Hondaea fermentalgiana TaxID=2315210 RepID=A0A2R5GVB9_9STRA|nr:Guanine/hypoxanthine permease pbuG [Hondaea fermentalgiana]|eukprot:GBG33718.1 Guanine/hypoxanthine permease pbuG [Hondaea fermentalgiana]
MGGWLERTFKLRERGTNARAEFRAGTATFLTMAYILLLNAEILGKPHTGLEPTDVVIGTAVSSALGSFIVGYFANLPFGLAPGLGLSAYLSYGLIKGKGIPWEGALTSAFLTGAIMTVLAVTHMSNLAMRFIPVTIKIATVIGMGLLLTFIGMQTIDLVVAASDDSLVKLGPLDRPELWISLGGLLLQATLTHHQIRGGVVIGIMVVTLIMWAITNQWPTRIVELPIEKSPAFKEATRFDLISDDPGVYTPGVLAFLLVGVFDVSGVMFGLAHLAGLHREEDNGHVTVPKSEWVFFAAGVSTMVAAVLGCSPIIVHIESAAGIKEGGRTGLTACVVSGWFLMSLFFAPLLGSIPQEATAPVVILIGASMMGQASEIDWKQMRIAVPAFLTLSVMPFTFSIPNGIAFGLASNLILHFTCRKWFADEPDNDDVDYESLQASNGGPVLNQSAATISYGTAENQTPSPKMPRSQSSASFEGFMRSPTLVLRKEAYSGPRMQL